MTVRVHGDSVTVDVPPVVRERDPLVIKARAMAEYRSKLQAAGRQVSEAALERFVVHELNLVDVLGTWSRRGPRRTAPPRRDVAAEAAQHGVRLWRGDEEHSYVGQPVTRTPAHELGRKVSNAVARIGRILGPGARNCTDIDAAVRNAAVPHLAREFMELWWYFQIRDMPSRHNPFTGLNDVDANRKFLAMMFDICDRSTGIPWLRHWHTK